MTDIKLQVTSKLREHECAWSNSSSKYDILESETLIIIRVLFPISMFSFQRPFLHERLSCSAKTGIMCLESKTIFTYGGLSVICNSAMSLQLWPNILYACVSC